MFTVDVKQQCNIQFVYTLSVNTTKFATKRVAVDLLIYFTIVWPPLDEWLRALDSGLPLTLGPYTSGR